MILNLAEEDNLVQKAREGDTRAFAELVRAHQQFAYHVALRALNNTQDAEDIVQEAFVKVWESLTSFRHDSRFRTWLYRIVMNLCYNQLPRLRKDINALDQDSIHLELSDTNLDMDPVLRLEGKETLTFIQQQIKYLPDQYRIMLLLRYQQGCSYAEISEILDVPLGTVKTGIFRARERLKDAVYEYFEERVLL
ncbi:MAG: sigma-70 family RNA polymerase sigma factor [Anaerolineales bacterium]|nr:sigma-70 family RNA polymerase sigma factor [Anaerolineales bacterium]